MLDAVQDQIFQLEVPVPDAPTLFINIVPLVELSHNCAMLAKKTCSILRVVISTCLYERIHNLCDLEGKFRPGDWSTWLSPVNGVYLQTNRLDLMRVSQHQRAMHIHDGSKPYTWATVRGEVGEAVNKAISKER